MRPPLLLRLRWWLDDLREVSPFARLRRQLTDGKIGLAGLLVLVLVLLVGGGFAAARAVAGASGGKPSRQIRVITRREKVRVKVHGHLVTRWRTRKLYARAATVMQTQTIHTPHGIRIVRRPVTRYQVVYRKRGTRTVSQPVTDVQTITSRNTSTQYVTVTNHVTDTQTITRPVTVVETTTIVSTETDTLPITVTITVP